MSLFMKFYFTSSMLNMFRILILPSSGACDFSVASPHWWCVLVSKQVGLLFFKTTLLCSYNTQRGCLSSKIIKSTVKTDGNFRL